MLCTERGLRTEEKNEFYGNHTGVLRSVNRGDIMIVMVIFNALVGSDNSGLESTMCFDQMCREILKFIGGRRFDRERECTSTIISLNIFSLEVSLKNLI